MKNQIDHIAQSRFLDAAGNDAAAAIAGKELGEVTKLIHDSERLKMGVIKTLAPLSVISSVNAPQYVKDEMIKQMRGDAIKDLVALLALAYIAGREAGRAEALEQKQMEPTFLIADTFKNSGRYDLFPEFIDTLINENEIPEKLRKKIWALVSTLGPDQEAICAAVTAAFQDSEDESDLEAKWNEIAIDFWPRYTPNPLKTEIDSL